KRKAAEIKRLRYHKLKEQERYLNETLSTLTIDSDISDMGNRMDDVNELAKKVKQLEDHFDKECDKKNERIQKMTNLAIFKFGKYMEKRQSTISELRRAADTIDIEAKEKAGRDFNKAAVSTTADGVALASFGAAFFTAGVGAIPGIAATAVSIGSDICKNSDDQYVERVMKRHIDEVNEKIAKEERERVLFFSFLDQLKNEINDFANYQMSHSDSIQEMSHYVKSRNASYGKYQPLTGVASLTCKAIAQNPEKVVHASKTVVQVVNKSVKMFVQKSDKIIPFAHKGQKLLEKVGRNYAVLDSKTKALSLTKTTTSATNAVNKTAFESMGKVGKVFHVGGGVLSAVMLYKDVQSLFHAHQASQGTNSSTARQIRSIADELERGIPNEQDMDTILENYLNGYSTI
ncbi:unnamed protein product, partial [Owenia fusiformis]